MSERDDCLLGHTKNGEVFLVTRGGAGRLTSKYPGMYCNLTPNHVGKTLPGGPYIPRPVSPVRPHPCAECNRPDTLYLGQRLVDCRQCGGTGTELRFA